MRDGIDVRLRRFFDVLFLKYFLSRLLLPLVMSSLSPLRTSTSKSVTTRSCTLTTYVHFLAWGRVILIVGVQKNLPKVTAPGKLIYVDDGVSFSGLVCH